MKLKEGVNVNSFLETARKCAGEIFLHTKEGDILNLKSLLSQYVLLSLMGSSNILQNAQIVCMQEEDYKMLSDYLEAVES